MKQLVALFIVSSVIVGGCSTNNASTNSEEDYNKKFDRIEKDFFWKRANNYKNRVDRFLIEKEFNESIRDSLRNIVGRPGTIWHNSFDTSRERREMLFIDSDMHYFYLLPKENSYTQQIQFGDSILFNGRLLGYFIDEYKENPELSEPTFVAVADSIIVIKHRPKN